MSSRTLRRRTRIVCVSDTHNTTPPLPKGDILIHAGDLTNQGSLSELQKAVSWIAAAPYEAKIVVAGNHDITLDRHFYAEHGPSFHNQHAQKSEECVALLQNAERLTYLCHSSAHIVLRDPSGPRTHLHVFGSPYSPLMSVRGTWAFQYPAGSPQATHLWSQIPLDTDVLVTHTPPYSHCDTSATKAPQGCEELRKALWRVRPKLHVCGHLHEGRGAEKVRWRLDGLGCAYREEATEFWDDPGRGEGSKKQSLVDLTVRSGWRLDHVGGLEDGEREFAIQGRGEGHVDLPGDSDAGNFAASRDTDAWSCREKLKAMCSSECVKKSKRAKSPGSHGGSGQRGDMEGSQRVAGDVREAMEGRLGRRETCIVNAAFMAQRWGGPKRFNKPLVVDVDLPVWQGCKGDEDAR